VAVQQSEAVLADADFRLVRELRDLDLAAAARVAEDLSTVTTVMLQRERRGDQRRRRRRRKNKKRGREKGRIWRAGEEEDREGGEERKQGRG